MTMKRAGLVVASTMMLLLSAGCAGNFQTTASSPQAAAVLQGSVHGGQQPVSGATIQLYGVGTTADKSAATTLLTAPVLTDGNGNFSITGLYSCTGVTQVYITATGGIPGGSLPNPNLAMMTALGACSSLTATTQIAIDENTTVAATSALLPYMSSYAAVGSGTSDAAAMTQAFALASQYVSPSSGQAPGQGIPAGYRAPISLINTLGNIISACINSTGGTAGDNTNCGNLFTLATPSGGTAPTDTIGALLNIAATPQLNTATLFNLSPAAGPFQPSLSSAPSSFQLVLQPNTATRSFYIFPETDSTVTPLYALVNNAQRTIDMTMYALKDTTFSGDLVAACNRGVRVRVILDQNSEKSINTPAYTQLNSTPNCQAMWANPQFSVTHQKSFIVDETQVAILSLNLESQYYGYTSNSTRDYALVSNDVNDIAAVQATFNTDYGSTTDKTYQPPAGDDLIWSPTTATADILGIINNAQYTLEVENEEMSASNVITAFENACKRGVVMHLAMTDTGSYHATWTAMEAAGCLVHVDKDSTSQLYVHGKAIVADYGTPGVAAYMGSINFSTNSLTLNRELGLYITDPNILQTLNNRIEADFQAFPTY